MHFQNLLLAVASAIFFSLSVSSESINPNGSINLVEDEALFTFEYETLDPHERNWIGLHKDRSIGLVQNGVKRSARIPVAWVYAPEGKGTVRIPAARLRPGRYTGIFCAKNGYDWLASPLVLYFDQEQQPGLDFVVNEITLRNARADEWYGATLAGFVRGSPKGVAFKKGTHAPEWLDLGHDGIIWGKPGRAAQDITFTVCAIRGEFTASIKVTIPVRNRNEMMVNQLRVMSMSLGSNHTASHDNQVRFIVESKADIIGLQDDNMGERAAKLAGALGWFYWASKESHSILSKYPICSTMENVGKTGRAIISLDGEWQMVSFWVAQLSAQPYGFCDGGMSADQVIQRESDNRRPKEIETILRAMDTDLESANITPVFLVGGFNAPSHLDSTGKHCDFKWPTSVKPLEVGLVDSFRAARPDPDPSPNEGITSVDKTERLNFVYHKGSGLEVVDSWVVMASEPEYGAVVTLYNVTDSIWDMKMRRRV
ncbi:hypothetical protein FZEAL_729 [Fusarium zealandicum]|uniref:Endonuclease/exonuclease/phosphatase domain-containing protein n=1 Tax=Fusarium zealandicum TaxID=1053134 RepID=A0A8H4UU41_9HYPO|nr:hypothetical protein FZEAL_729 [Fusarium zealandicum]